MRRLVGVLVVLLVLGGGAWVAAPVVDGAVRDRVEDRLAAEVVAQTGATGGADVDVVGRWFLPQALRGSYPLVRLQARGVPAEGLRLDRVDVELRDVTAPLGAVVRGAPQVRAGSTSAQVLVTAADVNALLRAQDRPLEVETDTGGDRLRATTSARVLGREVGLSGWVELELDGQQLRAVPTSLDVDGGGIVDRLSRAVLGGLRDQLAFTLPVEGLPLGQRVTGVLVTTEGVVLSTAGDAIIVAGS